MPISKDTISWMLRHQMGEYIITSIFLSTIGKNYQREV